MNLFSNGLRGWKRSWKDDLRASVSVAFIAIPLGLGIGLASGVPPMSAVIPAVVGGLIFAWFSGGNVIVHSTPKMLIGVTAAAIITLGADDLFQGYRIYLAAIVFAGMIQFLLGTLRLGVIGDLIPASVIKSLLAAVGIIIIVKQLPVLLGSHLHPKNLIELSRVVPEVMSDANPIVAIIGIASLVIMFIHSQIELPVVKAIPAAVWVIIVSILYSYGFDFQNGGQILFFGYGPEFLIDIPAHVSDIVVHPDFSLWKTSTFWNVVIAVVLITSIEGILSTKAIDRLDGLKRKSNINKELSISGLATSISGLIGGMPVIPGIVPSSVGVAHNGKGTLMNVFQAIWILVLIVTLSSQLQHIPLAALAGVLIHTGYKLINPKEIVNIYRIGWDQILVFSVTLIVTLVSDLIFGILAGTVLTIVIHIVRLRSVVKLFTILFRPNVVSYQEDEDDSYHISVRGYSNFLNYPQLKKALDVIPNNAKVVVDLSLAEFIDHTVMEHLAEREENHIRRGGEFEIIGLDTHLTSATHPLSVRYKGSKVGVSGRQTLTSRQQKLQSLAEEVNWQFDPSVALFIKDLDSFHLLRHKSIDRAYNKVSGNFNNAQVIIQDIDFHEGEFQTKVTGQSTVAIIGLTNTIPLFTIEKEYLFDRIAALAGFDDIDFKNFKKFSNTFRLKGEDEPAVRDFFSNDLIRFLEENLPYRLESNGHQILLIGKERPMSLGEIENLLEFTKNLIRVLPQH
ncbi:MAG: SulP family inorganic anion transporter [Flavobacteriales bacterium]|nr:SulP family inorganic anion transporter [Flavobacteriales bacterium]